MLQEPLQLPVNNKACFSSWIAKPSEILFKKQPLKREITLAKSYLTLIFCQTWIAMKENKFVTPWENKALDPTNMLWDREKMEISSISLQKENALLKKNRAAGLSKKCLSTKQANILEKLRWWKTLLDKPVSRQPLLADWFGLTETHSKDFSVLWKESWAEIWKNTEKW